MTAQIYMRDAKTRFRGLGENNHDGRRLKLSKLFLSQSDATNNIIIGETEKKNQQKKRKNDSDFESSAGLWRIMIKYQ